VSVVVVDIGYVMTCPGQLCQGLYGSKSCPCVVTSAMSKNALGVKLSLKGPDNENTCEQLGLRLETYISVSLTELLVDSKQLEV